MADRTTNRHAACGYGLLGLCCDACLQGPCRRSPFDDAGRREPCGMDSDGIVAWNLRERVLREGLAALAGLRNALSRDSGPGDGPGASPDAVHRNRIQALLSPSRTDGTGAAAAILPKGAFPTLTALGYAGGPWMAEFLDAAVYRPAGEQEPEALLAEALRLAGIALAAGALSAEVHSPRGRAPAPSGATMDSPLPDAPSPLLVIVASPESGADQGSGAQIAEIAATCVNAGRIIRLGDAHALPALAGAAFAKWGVPVSATRCTAVVASPWLTPGLGALALGFSLLAIPAYPIGGGGRVARHLTRGLQERFGQAYLAVPSREDRAEAVRRSLAP